MVDIKQLYSRVSAVSDQYKQIEWRERERAKTIANAILNISDEDLAIYGSEVPGLAVIREYTEEQLYENKNNELQFVVQVYSDFTHFIDRWLVEYEQALRM